MARMFKPPCGMAIECIGINEDKTAIVYNLRFLWWHPRTWLVLIRAAIGKVPTDSDLEVKECL